MFGCRENQKEFLHLFHKETHENLNDLNLITLARTKVQNSITILLLNPNPISVQIIKKKKKKKNPNPVIPLKFADPPATTKGFPSAK